MKTLEKSVFLMFSWGKKGEHWTEWAIQKQSSRSVPREKCSENMQQIYRRTPMSVNLLHFAAFVKFSPVNLLHIFRTPFPKNTSGRLLLKIITWHITCYMNLVEALIRHQKFHLACRESPTIALSHDVKIKENH